MKKILSLSIILVLFACLAQAQTARFGFTAGATLASQKWEEGNVSIKSDSKVGFTLGVLGDISISDNLSFQPGINFTQKGGKFSGSDFGLGSNEDVNFTLNYVELPLNVLFKAEAGSGKFFIGAGPSIGFGISGKSKFGSEEEDINFGTNENEDDYKPLDFGGNIVAGYELPNGVFFAVNYNTTLNNLSPYSEGTIRNRYIGFRIGFLLGGAKKDKK
jgi:Outer membrane protein beta-barrel domain